ncbi:MAG: response regulator, partial [Terriglobales bacterium]
NRDVAASFLRRAGHSVVEAEDGEAAVCRAAAQNFDVVLMDIRMPRLDGIAAAHRIRALPAPHGNAAIIAVTAYGGDADLAANDDAGFQACLLKPITRQRLLDAVAAATNPHGTTLPCGGSPESWATRPAPAATGADAADAAVMERHLAEFAGTLDRLNELMGGQNFGPPFLDLVHRIAGDAAQLGYAALADAARQAEAVLIQKDGERPAFCAGLQNAVTAVLACLDQRSDFARNEAMASTKLPRNRRCSAA